MKKIRLVVCAVSVFISVFVMVYVGKNLKTEVNANEVYNKQDIEPITTNIVDKKKTININKIEHLVPVLTGVSAYMSEAKKWYHHGSEDFYKDVINYVAVYAKDCFTEGIYIKDGKTVLSRYALEQLSAGTFSDNPYGYEDIVDEGFEEYLCDTENVVEGYSIKIDEAYMYETDNEYSNEETRYYLRGSVYKNGEKVTNVNYTLENNGLYEICESIVFKYAIQDVDLHILR